MDIKIGGYPLDKEQFKIATSEDKELLVVAGAGSGKTFTIVGRIWYLINIKKVKPEEILCISYTRDASNSLKNKLLKEFGIDMNVYTFHKLAINILRDRNIDFNIASPDILDLCIEEYLRIDILEYPEQLKYLRFILKINWHSREEYLKILDDKVDEINKFIKVVATFIKLYKCNGYEMNYFKELLDSLHKKILKRIDCYYILIIFNIYIKYSKYLIDNNEYDFDDVILEATKVIKSSNYIKNFKFIIIDEYQDSSYIRFNLIKEIVDNNNCNFMAVGDDFQSIYKFSGSDIGLFINFKEYFKRGQVLKIQTTYRNSQELVNIAGDFIMQNKKQIKKEMKANSHVTKPIKVVFYDDETMDFYRLYLYLRSNDKCNILILGRNNNDIKAYLGSKLILTEDKRIIEKVEKAHNNKDINGFKEEKKLKNIDFNQESGTEYIKKDTHRIAETNNYQKMNMNYMTMHRSKGLEYDDVIIINLKDDTLGFPSKLEQDKILEYIRKDTKKDFLEEERRLFYVALTRAKNNVYLFTPRKKESIFVKELLKNYKNDIEIIKKY